MNSFFGSFLNSLSGLRMAWGDHSFRNSSYLCLTGLILATIGTFYFGITLYTWLLLVGCLFPIVIIEAVNTSIEAVTDKASPERSLLAKKAKDIGSAAVMLAKIFALFCWLVVIYETFFHEQAKAIVKEQTKELQELTE